MCNKSSLSDRVEKARAGMHFSKIMNDKDGMVKTVLVPGSNGKQYQVIIRRNGVISTECRLCIGNNGYADCKGNTVEGSICYHSMTALMIAAKEQGMVIAWTANNEDAWRVSRLGGKVVKFTSFQNGTSYQYGIVKMIEQGE